jgi:hypothetical protein
MEQTDVHNAKFCIEIKTAETDNYFGYLEHFLVDTWTASKIKPPLKVHVDRLIAKIASHNFNNACALFKEVASQVKTIDLQIDITDKSEGTVLEQQTFDALESCVELRSLTLNAGKPGNIYSLKLPQILPNLVALHHLKLKNVKNQQIVNEICKQLVNMPNIKSISLRCTVVPSEAVEHLSKITSGQTLQFFNSVFDKQSWNAMMTLIDTVSTLKTLELRPIDEPQHLSDFCQRLRSNTSIKTLITDSKLFTKQKYFEEFLMSVEQSSCESLTIVKYTASNEYGSTLAKFLANNTTLKYLQLGKAKGKRTSGSKSYVSLTHDNKDYATIQDVGMIATALESNKTLQGLALKGWAISNESSMKKLAEALTKNLTLLTLDLSHSDFGPNSLQYIADIISRNKTLTKLNLRRNLSVNWPLVIDALINNQTLTSVDLSQSVEVRTSRKLYIENITIPLIKKLIENNTTLRELAFQRTTLTEPDLADLLRSLKHNTSLTTVDILAPQGQSLFKQESLIPPDPADVFSENYTLLSLKSHFSKKQMIEPYLRRNRQYRVDSIILLHNCFNDQSLPIEIWTLIFSFVSYFKIPLQIVRFRK